MCLSKSPNKHNRLFMKPVQCQTVLLMISKAKSLTPNKKPKLGPSTCKRNTIGTPMSPGKSGASVQKLKDQTSLWMSLKVCNILTRSKILLSLAFNGRLKRVSSVTKTCVGADSIFTMSPYTLTLSTEVVDKSSPPPEGFYTLASSLLNQDSSNQSTWSKSSAQKPPSAVSTAYSTEREVTYSKKPRRPVPQCSSSKLIFQSMNRLDSLPTLGQQPVVKPSHSVCSITGRLSTTIHSMKPRNPTKSLKPREREKVFQKASHHSIGSLINYKVPILC